MMQGETSAAENHVERMMC